MTFRVCADDGRPSAEGHQEGSLRKIATGAVSRAIVLPNTDLVIFDCDGVLIDSESIASRTMSRMLQVFGVAMDATEAHRLFTGSAEADTRIFVREKLGLRDVDEFFKAFNTELYREFEQIGEIDGISNIVRDIDCRLCVASNSSLYRLTRSLGRTDLWLAFRGQIFSADQVAKPKPAPDLLLHCVREMNTVSSRSIMIDDGTHGIRAAVAAGIPSIGFVDPNDPRPGRISDLKRAGAHSVAVGTDDLRECLESFGTEIHT